jgi:hypothetical protein
MNYLDWERASGWMGVVNQAASQAVTGTATTGSVTGVIAQQALVEAARVSTEQPIVRVNRARGAALIDKGYGALGTYDALKPYIFAASLAGAIGAGYMVRKRRRVPEAWPLYSVLGVLAAGVAWVTRPEFLRPAPAPVPANTDPSSSGLQTLLGWLDRHAAAKATSDPGWEARAYRRLAADLGFGTMPPYAETLLTRNSL